MKMGESENSENEYFDADVEIEFHDAEDIDENQRKSGNTRSSHSQSVEIQSDNTYSFLNRNDRCSCLKNLFENFFRRTALGYSCSSPLLTNTSNYTEIQSNSERIQSCGAVSNARGDDLQVKENFSNQITPNGIKKERRMLNEAKEVIVKTEDALGVSSVLDLAMENSLQQQMQLSRTEKEIRELELEIEEMLYTKFTEECDGFSSSTNPYLSYEGEDQLEQPTSIDDELTEDQRDENKEKNYKVRLIETISEEIFSVKNIRGKHIAFESPVHSLARLGGEVPEEVFSQSEDVDTHSETMISRAATRALPVRSVEIIPKVRPGESDGLVLEPDPKYCQLLTKCGRLNIATHSHVDVIRNNEDFTAKLKRNKCLKSKNKGRLDSRCSPVSLRSTRKTNSPKNSRRNTSPNRSTSKGKTTQFKIEKYTGKPRTATKAVNTMASRRTKSCFQPFTCNKDCNTLGKIAFVMEPTAETNYNYSSDEIINCLKESFWNSKYEKERILIQAAIMCLRGGFSETSIVNRNFRLYCQREPCTNFVDYTKYNSTKNSLLEEWSKSPLLLKRLLATGKMKAENQSLDSSEVSSEKDLYTKCKKFLRKNSEMKSVFKHK